MKKDYSKLGMQPIFVDLECALAALSIVTERSINVRSYQNGFQGEEPAIFDPEDGYVVKF